MEEQEGYFPFPVVKRIQKNNFEICFIDLYNETRYISTDGRTPIFHTESDHHYQMIRLEEIQQLLYNNFGYEITDRGMVVNLHKVTSYDKKLGKLYFDKEVNSKSIYATVASTKRKQIEEAIKERFDIEDDFILPVVKKDKCNSEDFQLVNINLLNDVLYVDVDDRVPTFHTNEGYLYPMVRFDEVAEFVQSQLGYIRTDRGVMVNIRQAKYYNKEMAKIYFDERISKNSQFATVSHNAYRQLKSLMQTLTATGT